MVTLFMQGMCANKTTTYTLEVKSQCWIDPYPIDSLNAKFGYPSIVYNIWQPAQTISWTKAVV